MSKRVIISCYFGKLRISAKAVSAQERKLLVANKELSNNYLSSLCMELHLVVRSGIPLEDGVSMLMEEETDGRLRRILEAAHGKLALGSPLHEALAEAGGFPAYMVELAQIGEQTGNLDKVLKTLSQYYQRKEETAASIRSAVLYPLVLLGVMLFVVLVLMVKVMPIFEDVYRQLGAAMSGTAETILRWGAAIGDNWLPIVIVAAVLVAAVIVCLRIPASRCALTRLMTPRKIGAGIARERFASALSMAISSGFDVDQAMEMAQNLCDDEKMRAKIQRCRAAMEGGTELASATAQEGIVTGLSARMLAMGVRTGSADEVLEQIADRTQAEVQEQTRRLISRLEPTLVIVMSVVVGVILLSVMLPLVGILTTLS